MGNINDYLDWRGDVPFSVDPFNEVDNLILSELVYTDFDGVMTEEMRYQPINIRDLRKMYFARHTRKEIRERISLIKNAPFLMDRLAEAPRFQNLTLCHYVNWIDGAEDEQMAAVTCFPGDGTAYVAYRGTDTTLAGWKESFDFSYRKETGGQREAVSYLNGLYRDRQKLPEACQKDLHDLRVGGHSKGGNFAVYASSYAESEVRDRIREVYSNDGPGFVQEITDSENYQSTLPKIISLIPEGSMVGVLLSNQEKKTVVESRGKGVMQHDPFTWKVKRNRFVRAKGRTIGSIFFDETMQGWLSRLTPEEKKIFINDLFGLLESTHMETYSEIAASKWKAVKTILGAARRMPKGKRQEFIRILRQLLTSTKEQIQKRTPSPLSSDSRP